jgi:hypothetical protein
MNKKQLKIINFIKNYVMVYRFIFQLYSLYLENVNYKQKTIQKQLFIWKKQGKNNNQKQMNIK